MKVFVSDFETHTQQSQYFSKNGHTGVYRAGIKSLEHNARIWITSDLNEYMRHIEALAKRKSIKIYFHNLSFDSSFMWLWLTKHYKPSYQKKRRYPRKGYFTTFITNKGNKVYMVRICVDEKKYINIYCSLNLLSASVDNLGKTLNLNKLKNTYDYDKGEEQDIELIDKYLERDIDIVREYLRKNKKISKKLTVSSWAYDELKKYVGKEDFKKMFAFTPEQRDEYKGSYKGGMTGGNPLLKGKWIGKGKCIDICSSYPYALTQDLPFGQPLKAKPNIKHLTLYKILINEAVLKKEYDIPTIPSHIKNFNGTQNFLNEIKHPTEYQFWAEELEYHKTFYNIDYLILDKTYFLADNFLKDFMEPLYNDRLLAKKAKDDISNFFIKLIMNSCYGKFAQDYFTKQKRLLKCKCEKITKLHKDYNGYCFTPYIDEKKPRECNYLPLASYVTSFARCRILELLKVINQKEIYYWDTDSLYTSYKGYDDILATNKVKIGNNLGNWKVEGTFKNFKYLKSKCYYVQDFNDGSIKDKVVIAGLPSSEKHKINRDNFKIGTVIKDGDSKSKWFIEGRVIIKKDYVL